MSPPEAPKPDAPKSFLEKAKGAAANVAANAKAAAQIAGKQAEHGKLTQMTLPSAYSALGKDIHGAGRFRDEFGDLFTKMEGLLGKIQSLKQAHPASDQPQKFTDRAKAAAGHAMDLTKAKAVEMEANGILRELGKRAYEKLGENAGAANLVQPIAQALARLETLDREIKALSESHAGGFLTPKRLLVGGGTVIALVVLLAVGSMFKEGADSKTSRGGGARQESGVSGKTRDLPKEIAIDLGSGVKLEMVLIPAGEFTMGSPDSGKDAVPDEKPQHRVRITNPFYLGKHLLTREQWEAVMGSSNTRNAKAPKNPVVNVSYIYCQQFIEKINAKIGTQDGKFVLPTEAQWEYACRAGSTTKYCFGDEESGLGDYAWYKANSPDTTHPVGEKKPNAWGLYDMHGNVYEWCADLYDPAYYAKSPMDDPRGPRTDFSYHVVRGGSSSGSPWACRSDSRSAYPPWYQRDNLGLRVSRVPVEVAESQVKEAEAGGTETTRTDDQNDIAASVYQLELGATESEVRSLLGKPAEIRQVSGVPGAVLWIYNTSPKVCIGLNPNPGTSELGVSMYRIGDKSYAPKGFGNSTQPVPVDR